MIRGGALVLAMVGALASGAAAEVSGTYRQHCAACHGAEGRGDGPAAGMLSPRPRDFTEGRYKFRSTPTGRLPPVQDVARTIRAGLPGTSMPGYGDVLAPEQIDGLARYVLGLAPDAGRSGGSRVSPPAGGAGRNADARGRRAAQPVTTPAPGRAPATAPAARSGADLYTAAGCGECHGADGRTPAPADQGPALARGAAATDLTEPWTFRGGSDEASIVRRILVGIDGSAMPSYADALTLEEARAIAGHVRSLAREPIWRERDPATIASAGVAVDPRERGRYLVNAMQCPLCHTPISAETGAYDTAYFLAGGMRVSAYPWGVWYSRNLTSDDATGLGRWTQAEIVRAITQGVRRDGRRLDPMAMPWPWFSRLRASDAEAIATYLKTLPPLTNAVPEARNVSIGERAGGTMLALLGATAAVQFWGGNAALTPEGDVPASAPRRVAGQAIGWAVAGLAAGALVVGARRRRRSIVAVGVAVAVAWAAASAWPPFRLMSPDVTTRWLLLGMPALPAALTGPERALAERGEYLATIAPCGLCHTPASAFTGFLTGRALAGGMEATWRVYGRAVSTNLTPHRDGIGAVDDVRLLRAMRSGVGVDGRRMHWQAMPWDIVSNWSEEDLRAMLAYFRALPPVKGRPPPPRPPAEGDPAADTFAFGDAIAR